MNVVIHGGIGAGKSTAVRAAMRQLGWTAPGGFFTHWDGRERGADVLYVETWTGAMRPMARRTARPAAPGRLAYELDAGFAAFAAATFVPGPVVIDELGLIELDSANFRAAAAALFRGPGPVLAVVQQRALAPWLAALGSAAAPRLFPLAAAARATLPGQVAAAFRA